MAVPDSLSVTVILVTYNSAAVVADCLLSIPPGIAVVVVDNASTDETLATVAAIRPDAQLLPLEENIGFGRANNRALAQVDTKYALLLNPDARLAHDALARLYGVLEKDSGAAAAGPRFSAKAGDDAVEDVSFLSGAAMLVRMEVIRSIGGFDPRIFLYFEDDDLCHRLRAAGYRLLQVPSARVVHLNRRSSPDSLRIIFRRGFHYGWSRIYLRRKYDGCGLAWITALLAAPYFLLRALGFGLALQYRKALLDAAKIGGVLMAVVGA